MNPNWFYCYLVLKVDFCLIFIKVFVHTRTACLVQAAFVCRDGRLLFLVLLETRFVEARIKSVEILAVQPIGQEPQVFAEALVVDDFARSEEADRVDDVGIVTKAQDVIIGGTRLLLCRETLVQIGDGITLAGDREGVERHACRRGGVDAGGMVDKVGVHACLFDFLFAEVARQLIDDGSHHLKMVQLFGTP